MPFTFIALVGNTVSAVGTTLDATASLNVAAGDLLIAWCKHEGTNGTFAVAKDSGSPANTFTFDAADEINHTNADLNGSFGYVLSAAADATALFRLTTSSRTFRRFLVMQFRPDAGAVVTKNGSNVGQGNGLEPASGTFSPTGTDIVACGGFGDYVSVTTDTELINGVAATEPAGSPIGNSSVWYRILTTGFVGGTASATTGASGDWICAGIAFQAVAGGAKHRKLLLGVR